MSFDNDAPTDSISAPPMAASALKSPKTRQSLSGGFPLSQSDVSLPYRERDRDRRSLQSASLYAATLSPPGSRPQSPSGSRPPSARIVSGSVFGGAQNNALALTQAAGESPGDPLNLILQAFVPNIAVYASEDTETLIKEKGFSGGLWELLRPYGERVQGKVIIRDSHGASRTYEDYSVHFTPLGQKIEHPEPTSGVLKNTPPAGANGTQQPAQGDAAKKSRQTIEAVEAVVERHLSFAEDAFFTNPHAAGGTDHGLDIDVPSPYYALYMRRLLSGLPISPHESFSHPVACIVAISSRTASPIETLRRLYTDTSTGDKHLPNWVDPEFLRYYVLVHDEEKDDITKSMALFDQMRRNLGLNCDMLRIRGTQSAETDDDSIPLPRAEWMSAAEELADIKRSEDEEAFEDPTKYIFESDATAIRTFVREMVTKSIIPNMERQVALWNDQVASKRKGVAGRFLGLTKRWGFGSSSRSSGSGSSSGSNYEPLGFYRHDTPEAIMRKLADYSFMLRDWKLAYSTYDIIRGDFNSDKAWRYHAAANEMAALSLLIMPQNLSSKTRAEALDSMFEAAVYSYLTRCTAPYGALRCLVLGMELLRLRGGTGVDEAAKWGIRLLESKIMGPVGDALIKERLAVCYASKQGLGSRAWGSRPRKSALWSILGAEAWLEQAKHIQAQRCLNEARLMYSELSAENGIDKFAFASGYMLSLGQQLNEHLREFDGDDDDDGTGADSSEVIDEESEALDTRGRKGSVSRPMGTSLETAPLHQQGVPAEDERDPGKPEDDFG
ncbi:putativeTRAPP complex protein TRS85 [Microdochium trichocladiopsis]|uniref:PutativeTRAPP complex protein TRS85 n=1 Tax=Microdochium trichocladiopsis TaxID=1682393 RepID=A0A9P8YC79_9PEZI|nr:putativeTRAPP complex protein TRS85 [Microdochium trichocladiopsis]KAH7035813.1 putativeTRAPP complex protein TRS85 [Microdochium trichocladiopsis]